MILMGICNDSLQEGEEEEEGGAEAGAGAGGGGESSTRRRVTNGDSARNGDTDDSHRNCVNPIPELAPSARNSVKLETLRVEPRPSSSGVGETGVTEPGSPPRYGISPSPNFDRPENIYENLEELPASGSASTVPTHWRFKMFKTGSKNSKPSTSRNNSAFAEYDAPKVTAKNGEKRFTGKGKGKARTSPTSGETGGPGPVSLNVCFGKRPPRSPSNSQTLEFNDRSRAEREVDATNGAGSSGTCPRAVPAPSAATGTARPCIYGRLGNTYGRLQVLGSGIGRIERHLSSSCGNIDHYCTPPARPALPRSSAEGNPRFRIENQAVEADRIYHYAERIYQNTEVDRVHPNISGIYQNIDQTYQNVCDGILEDRNRTVAGPSGAPGGIKGISKGSLQWLMVNRWLPLWVANTGGRNDYKVIDLDFSIYDDPQYPACTAACADERCHSRGVFRTCNPPGRNYPPVAEREVDGEHFYCNREENHPDQDNSTVSAMHRVERSGDRSRSVECESPEPDSSDACCPNNSARSLPAQDNLGENDQDFSVGDNDHSVSECTLADQPSASSDTNSRSSPVSPDESSHGDISPPALPSSDPPLFVSSQPTQSQTSSYDY